MPEEIFTQAELVVDARALQTVLNQISVGRNVPLLDSTAISHVSRRNIPGIPEPLISVEGYFDSDEDAVIAQGIAAGTQKRASVSPQPMTPGTVAYSLPVYEGRYQQGGRVAEMHPFSLELPGTGDMLRGLVAVNQTHQKPGSGSDTLTGTAIQLGAIAAGQTLHAVVHVKDAAIFNQIDPIVESDDDSGFPTPTTQITMTAITFADGTGAYTASVAGPITDDWFRMLLTVTGVDTVVPFFTLLAIA